MARVRILDVDNSTEKRILIGLAVSKEFCKEVVSLTEIDYFQSKYTKIVAEWCVSYFEKYDEPISENIESVFEFEKTKKKIADTELIERFLETLSSEYKRDSINVKYLVDQALAYYKKRSLAIAANNIQVYLQQGDMDGAEKEISMYRQVAQLQSRWVDPFASPAVVAKAFEESTNSLFTFEAGLGRLLGPVERGWLVGILAPMKKGKTFSMLDWAMTLASSRLNVAFFSLEMQERHVNRRIYKMLTAFGDEDGDHAYPCFDCYLNQNGSCEMDERENSVALFEEEGGISKRRRRRAKDKEDDEEEISEYKEPEFDPDSDYKVCTACRGFKPAKGFSPYQPAIWRELIHRPKFTLDSVWKRAKGFNSTYGAGRLQVRCYPKFSANLKQLRSDLAMLEDRVGFIPDAIVIDYADILAKENNSEVGRDAINTTWMTLGQIASETNCLVLTASQSNRPGISKASLEQEDTADDIRKIAHVDIMMSLNQTNKEKTKGVMRYGLLAHRHKEAFSDQQALTLQYPTLGQVHLDSMLIDVKGSKYVYRGS